MLSLYVHIPFCSSKCAYCSFNSIPISFSDTLINHYIQSLKKEIDHYATTLSDKHIKTLYIWWGTPNSIGVDNIIDIIDYLQTQFDFKDIAELSIELNPYPKDEILYFVDLIQTTYTTFPRIRFSFWIQTFDDQILHLTWRPYRFVHIAEFLRSLFPYKRDTTVFNFDFIAFGKFQVSKHGYKQLWHEFKRIFFQDFLRSWLADSISLYTLEKIHDTSTQPKIITPVSHDQYYGTDDDIMEEFQLLKWYIQAAWYQRYEISNFAHAGKASIHNMAYRHREPYLGLWLSAASLIDATRWTNTWDIHTYILGKWRDDHQVQVLTASDILIEEFFLKLRTKEWITNLEKFKDILVVHYEWLLANLHNEGLVKFDGKKLHLTDKGMNVYNSIITNILKQI